MTGIGGRFTMNTLTHIPAGAEARSDKSATQPFLNPYLAGFLLGLVLLAT